MQNFLKKERCYGRGTGDGGEGQSQSTTYTHLKMSLLTQYHVQLTTHNEKNIKNCFKNTDTTNRHKPNQRYQRPLQQNL